MWFSRALDLRSGGPGFKSFSLPQDRFAFGGARFNSSTLCKYPTSQPPASWYFHNNWLLISESSIRTAARNTLTLLKKVFDFLYNNLSIAFNYELTNSQTVSNHCFLSPMFFKMSTVSSDWSRTMQKFQEKKKFSKLNLSMANKEEKVTYSTQTQIHVTSSLVSLAGFRFPLWSRNTLCDNQTTHIEPTLTSNWRASPRGKPRVLAWGNARRCEGEIQGGKVWKNEVHAYKTRASHAQNRVPHACATLSYSWVIVKLTCCHVYRCLPSLPEDDTSSVVSVCGSEIMGYTFTWWRNDRYKTKKYIIAKRTESDIKTSFVAGGVQGL